ncbi:MAG: putative ABC transporter permease, partial [Oscillospiraceae bacterium]|nr:putative ABC transporter permease [Oscillospiraceae bacterium]
TSWYLEFTKGMRWWDYTGYFLNLNGRICSEGLLVFGLGGLAVVYLIAPLLDQQISKLKNTQVIAACLILLAAYNVDAVYTKYHPNVGKGITDYSAYQEADKG